MACIAFDAAQWPPVPASCLRAALIGARWQLIAFVAPLLGVLCSIGWQRTLPEGLRACRAGPAALLRGRADAGDRVGDRRTGRRRGRAHCDGRGRHDARRHDREREAGRRSPVAADRWGRYPDPRDGRRRRAWRTACRATGPSTRATSSCSRWPHRNRPAIPKTELLDRLGTHLTRHIGPGVEYADIRPYVPGDQLRTVNWPVSARRGSLHVTERLTDRAADVVVLIDMYAQPPGPATDATERALRGAVQVVQSALRSGDRAGIVTLGGGRPRWLGADIGRRQFYRVLDTAARCRRRIRNHDRNVGASGRPAAGAIVVAFSTMLDTEFALSLIDLRRRGHTVVAVDVLEGAPFRWATQVTRCSPGCGRCRDRSCTAIWAPSVSTSWPGHRRTPSTSR